MYYIGYKMHLLRAWKLKLNYTNKIMSFDVTLCSLNIYTALQVTTLLLGPWLSGANKSMSWVDDYE